MGLAERTTLAEILTSPPRYQDILATRVNLRQICKKMGLQETTLAEIRETARALQEDADEEEIMRLMEEDEMLAAVRDAVRDGADAVRDGVDAVRDGVEVGFYFL